jgi:hypothetical protein
MVGGAIYSFTRQANKPLPISVNSTPAIDVNQPWCLIGTGCDLVTYYLSAITKFSCNIT